MAHVDTKELSGIVEKLLNSPPPADGPVPEKPDNRSTLDLANPMNGPVGSAAIQHGIGVLKAGGKRIGNQKK